MAFSKFVFVNDVFIGNNDIFTVRERLNTYSSVRKKKPYLCSHQCMYILLLSCVRLCAHRSEIFRASNAIGYHIFML